MHIRNCRGLLLRLMTHHALPLSVELLLTCGRSVADRPLCNTQYAQHVHIRGEILTLISKA